MTDEHRGPNADQSADKAAAPGQSKRLEDDEIKPYVLAGELGKGSFAVVYKGIHQESHEQVAIKTVSRSNLTTKLFDSLQSEIDILKSLSHRHITKLINIIKAERNIYLIMEYCSGGDLSGYIKSRGRVETLEYIPSPGSAPIYYPHPRTGGLDEIVVRSFLRQLARALKFLRQRNLVHRDIKPQNLLLKPASSEELARGHPLGVPILKIADFGFARSLPNAMMAETLCGSPLYMAPEILRYEKYDAKADLWSVGAVLYEMSVGKPPFRAQNHIQLLKKIEQSKGIKFPDEDPAAREKDPDMLVVPSDIKKLIRSLLKRFPAERASFENFFDSTAVAKSKFPRPPAGLGNDDASSSSKSAGRTGSSEDQEAVVIGMIKRQTQGQARILLSAETPTIDQQQAAPAPEVLDTKAAIVPPKFNFRRRDSGLTSPTQEFNNAAKDLSRDRNLEPRPPTNRLLTAPALTHRPLSTEASIIPGETEEDGMLRREYVMVGDTRAIEFNQTVDEIHADRRRSSHEQQPMSVPKKVEKRQSANFISDRLSTLTLNTANTTFPPAPNFLAPSLSGSPSQGSALTRALSLASKKLFGASGAPRIYPNYFGRDTSSSPRRQPLILSRPEAERDPIEEDLLMALEELAQKTDVLTNWADEMYEYVKAIPKKPLPDPAKFTKRDGETDSHAERRRDADADAEYNALTCIALYMLLMTFSQKGIDKLRVHQEGIKMRYPEGPWQVSEGFDDALGWFKEHFVKCNDRAALVKSWLPENSSVQQMWLDRLIYDHALQLSRKAAKMELIDHGSSALECERLYEESLWCLYALQDDIMQTDNPFHEEDAKTITDWISKMKARLLKCRARREMSQGDRLRDAQMDRNLDSPSYRTPWGHSPA